jgi:hypothetical protein
VLFKGSAFVVFSAQTLAATTKIKTTKMNNKPIFILLTIISLLILGCKKEQQTSNTSIPSPSITGLWEVNLLTITHYDNSNNVIKIDTVTYTDAFGEPVTMLEKYTTNNHFLLFTNSINDTSISSTFTQNGNNIKINLSDNVFPFNNRIITRVDSLTLELYQMINNGSSNEKWIQKYSRR